MNSFEAIIDHQIAKHALRRLSPPNYHKYIKKVMLHNHPDSEKANAIHFRNIV